MKPVSHVFLQLVQVVLGPLGPAGTEEGWLTRKRRMGFMSLGSRVGLVGYRV